jgi:dTDP-4-dehydrorhamnose 3,5-epimerase
MAYTIQTIEIPGIIIVKSDKFYDERGHFMELNKISEFKKLGLPESFPQYNLSYSKKNVIRGLHHQQGEHAQGKLVYLVHGHVRDVFVDMRSESPTYKKTAWIDLQGEDNTLIYIPPGFAHGFSVLSDDAYFLYACTNEYNKAAESGIRFDDPSLNIDWGVSDPIVSDKDKQLPQLS